MASDLFSKANEEFVNENYEKALTLYTEAVQSDNTRDEIFANRAQTHIKLNQYKEAEEDANKAIVLNSKNVKAFFRKGIALFYQEQYTDAKESFIQGQKLDSEDSNFMTWISKCEEKLASLGSDTSTHSLAADLATAASAALASPLSQVAGAVSALPPKAVQQKRHDWYQTATHVTVTILMKQVKKEDLATDIQEDSLSVKISPPSAEDFSLAVCLAHNIDPASSSIRVMPSKIEIKLKKREGIQWQKLECDGTKNTQIKQISAAAEAEDTVHKYPSSNHNTRNWDSIEHEVKEEEKSEKLEGDAALQQLFQKIYADGNDEVKKAMQKSFYESGGTVLSTNWGEIGAKKVDVKPPDGMEYKNWES